MLNTLILFSIFNLILILLVTKSKIRDISLLLSFINTFLASLIWLNFERNNVDYQFFTSYNFFGLGLENQYLFAVDGISINLIWLSALLINICVLSSYMSITFNLRFFYFLLFLINFLLIIIFSTVDLLIFYMSFEAVLIPVFLLIGVWGSRKERVVASFYFFFFTFFGSLFLFFGILYIYNFTGSTSFFSVNEFTFPFNIQCFLWLSFFFSFAIKVPMYPFHTWLPQAHAEAPTTGSLLLAGILLKLGGYGFMRFNLLWFPEANQFFLPLVFTISIISVIYASAATVCQVDAKRLIAYSSIAHMNYAVAGIFSGNYIGILGGYLMMLSHGLTSVMLFLIIGFIYERYHSRIIAYYGGLNTYMPLLSSFALFASFANFSFPGTSGFIGETLIIFGLFTVNKFISIILAISTLFAACYSIWLFNRIFYYKKNNFIVKFSDVNRREFYLLTVITILILIFGIYPKFIIDTVGQYIYLLIK